MTPATCPICNEVKDLKQCEIHEDYPGRYPCKECLRLSRQERYSRAKMGASLLDDGLIEGETSHNFLLCVKVLRSNMVPQ